MEQNLSVILIAHNEEKIIGMMIEGLLKDYPKEILEVVVVNDASTDKTSFIVESWMNRDHRVKLIKRIPPCGVGRAIKTGFNNVDLKADYVLTMDSDFIENIKEVRLLIRAMEEKGCDVVIGSRFIKGSRFVGYPLEKRIMNRLFHLVVKVLLHIKQKDLTNNFKLFKTNIVRKLPWKSNGYSINAETGILPIIFGWRVKEVPVSWIRRDLKMGSSKFRLFLHGWPYTRVIIYAWKFLRWRRTI